MFRSFGVRSVLAISVAAALASAFTFVTATPSIDQLHIGKLGLEIKQIYDFNRAVKGDRLPMHLIFPQVTIPETNDNTTVNQNSLERILDRTKIPGQNTPLIQDVSWA